MLWGAIICLALINVVTWAVFAIDKQRSRKKTTSRISEATLLKLMAVGGSLGGFCAQYLLRHKTRKQPFKTYMILILAAQIALTVAFYIKLY